MVMRRFGDRLNCDSWDLYRVRYHSLDGLWDLLDCLWLVSSDELTKPES